VPAFLMQEWEQYLHAEWKPHDQHIQHLSQCLHLGSFPALAKPVRVGALAKASPNSSSSISSSILGPIFPIFFDNTPASSSTRRYFDFTIIPIRHRTNRIMLSFIFGRATNDSPWVSLTASVCTFNYQNLN